MNPLYQQMNNGGNDFLTRFSRFRKMFQGDPQKQIQELLNSGKVTQEQYNQAVQKAKEFQKILGM